MGRGGKPAKSNAGAKRPAARKSPKNDAARVRDLEKRLTEALKREAEALGKLQTRDHELVEAQEQQAATADILRVISSSPADIQPVLDTLVKSAVRFVGAYDATIHRLDGQYLPVVAHYGPIPYPGQVMSLGRGTVTGRSILERCPIHVIDLQAETEDFPEGSARAREARTRTALSVPLLREGVALGSIHLRRAETVPFTDKQIALLQTFADQAAIAVENVRLFTELQARNRELTEALEQQTATSEILRVISSSPTDVQPVFDGIIANAVRLCGAVYGIVWRFEGDVTDFVSTHNVQAEELEELRRRFPRRTDVDAEHIHTLVRSGTVLTVPDIETYEHVTPEQRARWRTRGVRSLLVVPMRRDHEVIGAIGVSHRDVDAFQAGRVQLLKTFADQAVIAIENVRLFTELQEKNRALTQAHAQVSEALDTQTATSDILRVISRSQTDVQPVFDSIVAAAVRLLGAYQGVLTRIVGDEIHHAASTFTSGAEDRAVSAAFPRSLHAEGTHAQAIRDRVAVNIADAQTDPALSAERRALARARGYRSLTTVPLLRHGEAIGTIAVTRREAGGFTDDEIALLQTFADQAVIAIENTRLFNETKEALEQQTATSEVLRVISRSPTDTQPVFQAIVESAVRLCHGSTGSICMADDEQVHLRADVWFRPETRDAVRARFPFPLSRDTLVGRAILDGAIVHVPDFESAGDVPDGARTVARMVGYRSALAMPMFRDGRAIGLVFVGRADPGPFSDDEHRLLQTFADQAVIAIENVRLFKELEARTADLSRSVGQLTALGEVGQAVSSSLDLETVLTTIVSRAVQLSGADGGVIFEYDEGTQEFTQRAATDPASALAEARRTTRIGKGEGVVGHTAVTLGPAQVPDITVAGAYEGPLREILIGAGVRAVLAVPMLRESHLIGCLAVTRNAAGDFPSETMELLRTFATQSALAIQNARLFREIEEKSHQLEVASQHKSEFLANMSHELRTPLNAIIGFSEVLTERMFGELNEKQEEYLKDIYASGTHLLSLINDILDLSKIEAGRMELELTDFHLPQAIENALTLVRERAGRRAIALAHTMDEHLGEIRGDERKVKQVLLNLLSNALKFTPEGGRVEVRAGIVDGMAEISVTDTGVGIAPEDQGAIFEEFRQVGTADKKAEGTGLGLTLCRKFIELHGGRIWVKSQVGVGSTFAFTIPVRHGE
jgi:GAF domain-containing protein